jgi:hypothetical protein
MAKENHRLRSLNNGMAAAISAAKKPANRHRKWLSSMASVMARK